MMELWWATVNLAHIKAKKKKKIYTLNYIQINLSTSLD